MSSKGSVLDKGPESFYRKPYTNNNQYQNTLFFSRQNPFFPIFLRIFWEFFGIRKIIKIGKFLLRDFRCQNSFLRPTCSGKNFSLAYIDSYPQLVLKIPIWSEIHGQVQSLQNSIDSVYEPISRQVTNEFPFIWRRSKYKKRLKLSVFW